MVNIAAWGTIGISTRASPGCKDGGAIYRPTHRDVEITPERMPSILDKKACSRSGATLAVGYGPRVAKWGGDRAGRRLDCGDPI
jgi:hypothetical protein